MKKTYINPTVAVFQLKTNNLLMASVPVGEEYGGETVLSREFDYDDEEEYEDY